MTETNSNDPVVGDDTPVTEDDLRALKYDNEDVETPEEEDETPASDDSDEAAEEAEVEEEQNSDDTAEEEAPAPESFTKEFINIKGDTPEEYARNLEIAYKNSTAEALRLKGLSTPPPTAPAVEEPDTFVDTSNPLSLYAQQKMDQEIADAYNDFKKVYNQTEDEEKYKQFTNTVAGLSRVILETEKRMASPSELYRKAAITLGWKETSEPDDKEKLGMAIKQTGAASKSSPATKVAPRSKVTDEMIAVNRKMYPGKTDAEIRKELEPFI